jgi:hypothetical protein
MKAAGVSRIEGPEGRGSGWMVRITRSGKTTHKWFADGLHGGKMKAGKAAVKYRAQLERSMPPPVPPSERMSSRNKTGHVGVRLEDKVQTRGRKKYQYLGYVASWSNEKGKEELITFSCAKYGKRAALKLATIARTHRSNDRNWVEKQLGAGRA